MRNALKFLHSLFQGSSKLGLLFQYFSSNLLICALACEFLICSFVLLNHNDGGTHEHAVLCFVSCNVEIHSVLGRAADKPAEDISSISVRWAHTVTEHEDRGSHVIGNYSK